VFGRVVRAWVVVGLVGCRNVVTVASPAAYLAAHHPRAVWVVAHDGVEVLMTDPHVRGDTIVGTVAGARAAFPLAAVALVRVVEAAPAHTAELVAALGAGAILVAVVVRGLNQEAVAGSCVGPGQGVANAGPCHTVGLAP